MEYDINFICENCDNEIIAPAEYAGKEIICPGCENTIKVPIPGLEEGLDLGEFVLEQKLGSGGMGEVWLSEQKGLGRKVALKILQPSLSSNERFIKRFLEEANMSGRLEHPNIVMAYSAGCVGSFYYLATTYIDGVELSTRLKTDHRLPEREALKIVKSVAEALRYAWTEHHMIHRDIKPSNIMIDSRGNPRVMDFGISKIIDISNRQANCEDICGTPEYISPEQIKGEPVDFHADIYSLGITLFQLISGLLPFKGETVQETLEMQLNTPFPDASTFNSGISPQCYRLIEHMTRKSPEERHSSWGYVISDIEMVLDGKMPVGKLEKYDPENRKVIASAPNAKINMNINRPVNKPQPTPPPVTPRETIQEIVQPEEEAPPVATAPPPLASIPEPIVFKKKKSKKPLIITAAALIALLAIIILWIALK